MMEKLRQLEVTTVSCSIQRNSSNQPRIRGTIIAESRQSTSVTTERQRHLWNSLTRRLQGRDSSIAILEMLPGYRLSAHPATGLIAMPVNREVRTKLNYQTEGKSKKRSREKAINRRDAAYKEKIEQNSIPRIRTLRSTTSSPETMSPWWKEKKKQTSGQQPLNQHSTSQQQSKHWSQEDHLWETCLLWWKSV